MVRVFSLIVVIFIIFSLNVYPNTDINENIILDGIPKVRWIYHIDVSTHGIAVVESDRKKIKVLLSDSTNFEILPDENNFFFYVSFFNNGKLILTGEVISEGYYKYSCYNLSGELVKGPLVTRNTIILSNDGKYFHSIVDYGNDHTSPAMYNTEGELLHQFSNSSGNWDLKYINSEKVLSRDGSIICEFSLPNFEKFNNYDLGTIDYSDIVYSTISGDGKVYAFQSHQDVIIVDIAHHKHSLIPKKTLNRIPSKPQMLLNNDGSKLVVFESLSGSTNANIYSIENDSCIFLFSKKIPPNLTYSSSLSFIDDNLVVCNYFNSQTSPVSYKSYVFDINSALEEGIIYDGAILRDNLNNGLFEIISINGNTALIRNIILEENH